MKEVEKCKALQKRRLPNIGAQPQAQGQFQHCFLFYQIMVETKKHNGGMGLDFDVILNGLRLFP